MSEYKIRLVGGEADEIATVLAAPVKDLCHITLQYRGRKLEASATDYFEAFAQIRLQLETEGLIPFCYGASLDVYPSGMCRDMAAGMQAYKIAIGKKPGLDDLVDIFDTGLGVVPASVSTQREHFDKWVNWVRSL